MYRTNSLGSDVATYQIFGSNVHYKYLVLMYITNIFGSNVYHKYPRL